MKYIKINNYIYECHQDHHTEINTLGLNRITRENLKIVEKSKIIINDINLSDILFDNKQELLAYISNAKENVYDIDIIDIEFIELFRKKLNNLIVNNNQKNSDRLQRKYTSMCY